ncbi:MAG: energy-coupling factor transporter transmembrane component T [Candidatus Nanoarchaeia archaeon]|nr:energy-coupling factor transporter transmembrane component T [Candidatus Nanoarchaeia archaeon]
MASIGLSSYVEKDSFFHTINPLTKLVILLCVIIMSFTLSGFVYILLLLLIIIPIAIKSKVLSLTFKPIFKLSFMFILLFIIQGLFHPYATKKLMDLPFGFTLWEDGLLYAAYIASRLFVMMVFGYWFVLTTHPGDLVSSLTKIGLPHALGYIILTTLQIIPRISGQMQTIIDAQRSRGLETEGNLFQRIKSFMPLLGPLFMGSVQQSVEKSMALEARAFSSKGKKTSYRKTNITNMDKIIMTITIIFSITWGVLSWIL